MRWGRGTIDTIALTVALLAGCAMVFIIASQEEVLEPWDIFGVVVFGAIALNAAYLLQKRLREPRA
jgi:hypothetical protein